MITIKVQSFRVIHEKDKFFNFLPITVERQSDNKWAIRSSPTSSWNNKYKLFETDPCRDNVTEDFIRECRYDSITDAMEDAHVASEIRVAKATKRHREFFELKTRTVQ